MIFVAFYFITVHMCADKALDEKFAYTTELKN